MPVYRVEHDCPVAGFGAWLFFHERDDAVSADCPRCGENAPATKEEVPR